MTTTEAVDVATKVCAGCRQEKDIDGFHLRTSSTDGRCSRCRVCRQAESLAYKDKNSERIKANAKRYYRENTAKHRAGVERLRLRKRAKFLIACARHRARKIDVPFDLDAYESDIQRRIDAGACELTGYPLRIGRGKAFDNPSIDRVVPERGYVYSNIRVVCLAVNVALGTWGEEVLLRLLTAWQEKRRSDAR